MDNKVELRSESGSWTAYCGSCGRKLTKTTDKIRSLIVSGKFETVDSFCFLCGAKVKFDLQLSARAPK